MKCGSHVERAARLRLPGIFTTRSMVESGGKTQLPGAVESTDLFAQALERKCGSSNPPDQ
jgi:hypothetical protein